jgi:hypothetical protein
LGGRGEAVLASLHWSEKEPAIDVQSREDLEGRLLDLAARSTALPLLVAVALPDRRSGRIGLGRSESIVLLQDAKGPDGWTREWISVGQRDRTGFTEFFLLGQHHSEFENRSLLPLSDAVRAIGEFVETGLPPAWIAWEQNTF